MHCNAMITQCPAFCLSATNIIFSQNKNITLTDNDKFIKVVCEIKEYLTDNNILFRILKENTSYIELYDYNEKGYKFIFDSREYPEFSKVYKPNKLYIQVYKGFINLASYTLQELRDLEYKYGIYLGKRITILTNNQ